MFDSNWQDANSRPPLIDYEEGTCSEFLFKTREYRQDPFDKLRAQHVLGPELNDAGAGRMARGKECAEVQIVGHDNHVVIACVAQDRCILRPEITYAGPVNNLMAGRGETTAERWREVHVEQEPHQPAASGTSCSPARHAAYASAARRSSGCRY